MPWHAQPLFNFRSGLTETQINMRSDIEKLNMVTHQGGGYTFVMFRERYFNAMVLPNNQIIPTFTGQTRLRARRINHHVLRPVVPLQY